MPNWCQCKLNISGSKKELARFARENKSRGRSLSFEKLLPTPDSLLETVSPKLGSGDLEKDMHRHMLEITGQAQPSDWYTWRVQKWGTKWDVGDGIRFEKTEDGVLYGFDTAWSPPLAWMGAAAKAYPALKFDIKYCECGNDFSGRVIYEGGKLVSEKEGTAQEVHPEEGFENAF
jgi:hypothetical protein